VVHGRHLCLVVTTMMLRSVVKMKRRRVECPLRSVYTCLPLTSWGLHESKKVTFGGFSAAAVFLSFLLHNPTSSHHYPPSLFGLLLADLGLRILRCTLRNFSARNAESAFDVRNNKSYLTVRKKKKKTRPSINKVTHCRWRSQAYFALRVRLQVKDPQGGCI